MHTGKFNLVLKSNSPIHSKRGQDLNPFYFVANFSVSKDALISSSIPNLILD